MCRYCGYRPQPGYPGDVHVACAEKRIADLEAMAVEMVASVPGGSICDPQQIADTLREIAAKHGVQAR